MRRWHLEVSREISRVVHTLVLWRPTCKDTLVLFSLSRALAFYFRGVAGRDVDCDGANDVEMAESGQKPTLSKGMADKCPHLSPHERCDDV